MKEALWRVIAENNLVTITSTVKSPQPPSNSPYLKDHNETCPCFSHFACPLYGATGDKDHTVTIHLLVDKNCSSMYVKPNIWVRPFYLAMARLYVRQLFCTSFNTMLISVMACVSLFTCMFPQRFIFPTPLPHWCFLSWTGVMCGLLCVVFFFVLFFYFC